MKPEFHCDDQWWVSPSNVTDDVRRSFSLSRRVQIHDATLRDGEQTSLLETSRQAVQDTADRTILTGVIEFA
jgi:hypothetical protein